jgi:hypothetical protein
MTISNQQSTVTLGGNGLTTVFTYPFLIPAVGEVIVSLTDTTVTPNIVTVLTAVQYTIAGLGNPFGGTVTYPIAGPALAMGHNITISRVLPIVQNTSVDNQGNMYPSAIEGALDYITMILQDIEAQLGSLTSSSITINSNITNAFATVAILKAAPVGVANVGSIYYLEGYYVANDGGGGRTFYLTNINPGADNGGTIIWSNTAGFYYVQQFFNGNVNAKWFGAKYDGATDDTTAHFNAMTAIYGAGGGTLWLPSGTSMISSLVFSWAAIVTVNIRGSGQASTILKKIPGTTTSVLKFIATGPLETYSEFSDFEIFGNLGVNDGLTLVDFGACSTRNLRIVNCNNALNGQGALLCRHYNPTFISNLTGYIARKNTVYANEVSFFGGTISGCTTYGMDIGQGSGLHVEDLDMEGNGTLNNAGTGAVVIRSTVNQESGAALLSFEGCWFEANNGTTFKTEGASSVDISITNSFFIGNNNVATEMNIGAVASIRLSSVTSYSPGSTWTLAAAFSTVDTCTMGTLVDTSNSRQYRNVVMGSVGIVNRGTSDCGTAVLVGGTVTVTHTLPHFAVIFVTNNGVGGTPGFLSAAVIDGTHFSITSSSGSDTSTVAWHIMSEV